MEQDTKFVTLQKIAAYVDLHNGNILEIGCGDGRITSMLAGRTAHIVALDLELHGLVKARAGSPGVHFAAGSGEELGFKDGSFDIVLFTLSLHHQDSERALREAHRVLKPGGRAIILEPAFDGEVEKICYPFNDERPSMHTALQAIDSCSLRPEQKEVFKTDWVFADKDELFDYLFAFYERDYNPGIVAEINAILGNRLHETPLILEDRIVIISLRK
jgi:ubiquinone/menaquinone biosynthesis C-methylase UbiE